MRGAAAVNRLNPTHSIVHNFSTARKMTGALVCAMGILLAAAGAAPAQTSDSAIAANFRQKILAAADRQRAETTFLRRENSPPISGWWDKRACRLSEIAFDVQRTNSLVSPLIGKVSLETESMTSAPKPDSAGAANAPADQVLLEMFRPAEIHLSYALQEGTWTLKTAEFRLRRGARLARAIGDDSKKPFEPMWEGKLGKADKSLCVSYESWASMK